jgi:hypothetical protein
VSTERATNASDLITQAKQRIDELIEWRIRVESAKANKKGAAMATVLLALQAASELVNLLSGIAAKAHAEGRDPTEEERAQVRAATAKVNELAEAAGI